MRHTGSLILLLMLASFAAKAEDTGLDTPLLESSQAIVTRSDFMAEISRIPEADRSAFLTDVKRVNAVLTQLYLNRVLAKEADALHLSSDPEVVRKLQLAKDKLLAQERMMALERNTVLPDFTLSAKESYLANQDSYFVEPSVHASHILINTKDRDEKEALKKAQEIREMLVSHSKTFEQAAEMSDDPSAKNNKGDLGWFGPKRMVKPFADEVFSMAVGAISQPVKTQFGYHIILLHEKKDGKQRSFDEVKQPILDKLRLDYITAARNNHMNDIKSDKSIVVHDAEISKLNPLNSVSPKPTEAVQSK